MNGNIASLENGNISGEVIFEILKCTDNRNLFASAEKIRNKFCKNLVHLRGIIEFSNECSQDCLYCGIRRSNRTIKRYTMTSDEIISVAAQAVKSGIKTIILQSGGNPDFTINELCQCVSAIKELDCAVTLSVGEVDFDSAAKFRQAGADRYLLKFETSGEDLYSQLKPGRTLNERLECHKILKKLGYQVGSGIMVGLPGQTLESIAKDILLFQKMDYDMIAAGPFIPSENTPLATSADQSGFTANTISDLVLKIIALCRILLKTSSIPATTAFVLQNPEFFIKKAFASGADVLMVNLTPEKYHSNYSIYPGRPKISCGIEKLIQEYRLRIEKTGYQINSGYGDRISH